MEGAGGIGVLFITEIDSPLREISRCPGVQDLVHEAMRINRPSLLSNPKANINSYRRIVITQMKCMNRLFDTH